MAREYDPPPHQHTAACVRERLTCRVPTHQHAPSCWTGQRRPTCGFTEHVHEYDCTERYHGCGHK